MTRGIAVPSQGTRITDEIRREGTHRIIALGGSVRSGEYDMLQRDSNGIDHGRRRFVRFGGVALFVATAGCTGIGGGESDDRSDGEPSRPRLTVVDASVSETTLYPDETLEITGRVENEGDRAGTFYAELRVDGVIVETQEVAIPAGDTESVTFTRTFDEPGEYELGVNDVSAGTVLVELAPAEFEIVETAVARTTIAVGEEVDVRATIANVGGQEGTVTAELQVDGVGVDTRNVSIEAGTEVPVTFTHAFEGPGRYEVSINGTTVDTVAVVPPAEFEIVDTAVERTMIEVGESVDVTVTVTNVGELEGASTVELERDGEVIATREQTIAPAETATVRFSATFEERGAYELGVNTEAPSASRAAGASGSGDSTGVGTVYVRECSVAVSETVTVNSGSSQVYEFELKDHADVTIAATTREGVDPTLTVVGPSGDPLVEGVTNGSIRETVTTAEAGRHEIGLDNDAPLPWRNGTWAVEIEICQW